jgi:hypothetical protein
MKILDDVSAVIEESSMLDLPRNKRPLDTDTWASDVGFSIDKDDADDDVQQHTNDSLQSLPPTASTQPDDAALTSRMKKLKKFKTNNTAAAPIHNSTTKNSHASGHNVDIAAFFSSSPVGQTEISDEILTHKVNPQAFNEALEQLCQVVQSGKYSKEPKIQRNNNDHRASLKKQRLDKAALEQARILGQPRDYQAAYIELCKQRNTIVHLGTGRGKSKFRRATTRTL